MQDDNECDVLLLSNMLLLELGGVVETVQSSLLVVVSQDSLDVLDIGGYTW